MTPRLDDAVELLDRSLAYTCGALADVADADLGRATPCSRWSLDHLLAHMGDALDAFLEAAAGVVEVTPPAPVDDPVGRLREKANALLGAWTSARPDRVLVGGAALASTVLVTAAALEITVHGWDVGQATGHARRVPDGLARRLLDAATELVDDRDRGTRFAPPRPVAGDAPDDVRLLAFLGRAGCVSRVT